MSRRQRLNLVAIPASLVVIAIAIIPLADWFQGFGTGCAVALWFWAMSEESRAE